MITGKYQYRFGEKFEWAIHGVKDYEDGLPTEGMSIAESLKKAGYTTGMYGKWHLGYKPPYLPANHGFDDFIGLGSGDGDHHTHINRWGKEDWWHNNELKMEEGYSTDLITDHSINFIKEHKEEPFFLYVSHLAIHFPWQGPDDPAHRDIEKDHGRLEDIHAHDLLHEVASRDHDVEADHHQGDDGEIVPVRQDVREQEHHRLDRPAKA